MCTKTHLNSVVLSYLSGYSQLNMFNYIFNQKSISHWNIEIEHQKLLDIFVTIWENYSIYIYIYMCLCVCLCVYTYIYIYTIFNLHLLKSTSRTLPMGLNHFKFIFPLSYLISIYKTFVLYLLDYSARCYIFTFTKLSCSFHQQKAGYQLCLIGGCPNVCLQSTDCRTLCMWKKNYQQTS